MSALSPRPWRKRTFDDGSRNIVSGPGGLGFVCQYSHKDGKDVDEAEADGTLIEAAPELIEALKTTLGNLDSLMATSTVDAHLYGSWREMVASAIAKAEGRR